MPILPVTCTYTFTNVMLLAVVMVGSIWIVDNSGSMQKTDGHRLIETGQRQQQVKFVQCSRWEEITECVCYHIQLAALLQAPTSFRVRSIHNNHDAIPRVHAGNTLLRQ